MKHAFLILAHNQFDILDKLIKSLDDSRNDIFVHFDKKVEELPSLNTKFACLHILNERVDVRWGDLSVVEAEILLFQKARLVGSFAYYHLLSGVDMPLKSQNDIHSFFNKHLGKQFIGFSNDEANHQIERKAQRYHFFSRYFRESNSIFGFAAKLLRFFLLRLQFVFNIRRNRDIILKKGTQWVSITEALVDLLLKEQENLIRRYRYTFCADEIFLHTLCWNSSFREDVFDVDSEGLGCQRFIRWVDNQIEDWEDKDFDLLLRTDLMFARKFNEKNMVVVNRILDFTIENA